MNHFKDIAQELYDFAYDHDDSSQIMSFFYDRITIFINEGLKSPELRGEKLDCSTGCASCCHLPVKCPPETIFFIAYCLQTALPEEQIKELKSVLTLYALEWNQISENKKLFTRLPCPFLDPNNACMIYEIRPFSCRAFTSTDVRVCEHLLTHPNDESITVTQNSFVFALFQLATTILSSVAKSKNRDTSQVYFIPSLLIALENHELESDWKSGKKLPYSD
ncbi:YkgJ family cysteine cluster protein [Curvivirga sp.]|uniref:YkgJ family cysteine cluster protein n=1 Tax=Curvivirga sp. TaxID=2856848 RepID=UPI003B5C3558